MADLSSLYNKRLGSASILNNGTPSLVGSIDLAPYSDSDCMFLIVAHCLAFRVAGTTSYPESYSPSVHVVRASGVYTLTTLRVSNSAPGSYGQVTSGVYTNVGIPGQTAFTFSLASSTLSLMATNISGGSPGTVFTKARAYLQIMMGDV